jgi:cell wall-associated NlpC family hydrolase
MSRLIAQKKLVEGSRMRKNYKLFICMIAFFLCVIVFSSPVITYASPITDVLSQVTKSTTANSASSDSLISTLLTLLGNLFSPLQSTAHNDTNTVTNADTSANSAISADSVPDMAGQTDKQNRIISTAQKYMGVPYVWGGTTTDGFDCSGFTQYVMQQNGISLPRTAAEQFAVGTPIDKADLQTGDLVFFTTYKPGASHVGIYMGDGNFINASSVAKEVTITALDKAYYVEHYIGARRYTK